jgi:hypothetical protein
MTLCRSNWEIHTIIFSSVMIDVDQSSGPKSHFSLLALIDARWEHEFTLIFYAPLGSSGWLMCRSHTREDEILVNLRREWTNRFIILDLLLKMLIWPIALYPYNLETEHSWVMPFLRDESCHSQSTLPILIIIISMNSRPWCCGFVKLRNLPKATHHSTSRTIARIINITSCI